MIPRTNLLALAFAASCAATPAAVSPAPATPPSPAPIPQAANDGEAVFKKMEAALTSAKSLQLDFESVTEGASTKGSFKTGEGNKLEMKIAGTMGVKTYELALNSDGQKMTLTRTEKPPPPVPLQPQPELEAPANLTAHVAQGLARGGAWLAQDFADGDFRRVADAYFVERQKSFEEQRAAKEIKVEPRDVTTLHQLKNFRSSGASMVTYDLVAGDGKSSLIATFTVTLDAKTGLPTKREGSFFAASDGKPSGPALSKWTETYRFR